MDIGSKPCKRQIENGDGYCSGGIPYDYLGTVSHACNRPAFYSFKTTRSTEAKIRIMPMVWTSPKCS